MIIEVNYLAVLVAGISAMVLGSIWYSPMLFGAVWMKESGVSKQQIDAAKKKGMALSYILNFIAALVTAYVLAHFLYYTNAATVTAGLQTAFWIWLGFIVTVLLGSVLWESKSCKYFLINVVYHLASLLAMSAILVAWPTA